MSNYQSLTAPQILTVIDLYGTFKNCGRKETLKEITGLRINPGRAKDRKSYPPGFTEDLAAAVSKLPAYEKAAIDTYVAGATRQAKPTLESTFARWITKDDIDSRAFADKCANDVGDYLILRMPSPKKLVAAHMKISFDPATDLMPHFETSSYYGGKLARQVCGQIFANGNYAYAVGKVTNNPGLRVSKLRPATLPTGQTDLYGIRLGQSREVNRPYGHLIYCLQLVDNKPDDVLTDLQSEDGMTQRKLAQRVPDLARIMNLLKPQKAAELGLTANADFG